MEGGARARGQGHLGQREQHVWLLRGVREEEVEEPAGQSAGMGPWGHHGGGRKPGSHILERNNCLGHCEEGEWGLRPKARKPVAEIVVWEVVKGKISGISGQPGEGG